MIRGDNALVLDNMRDDFPSLCQWVHGHGTPVTIDGALTYEIRDLSVTLLDPTDVLPLGVGRKLDLAACAAETLQLISGFDDPALLHRIGMERGRYNLGSRLRAQLGRTDELLTLDPANRHAVLSIWDPAYDVGSDTPNALVLQFLFRDEKLELHVTARSTDVTHCFHDFFAFAQLQLSFANLLGASPGPYRHRASAFYINARDLGLIDKMHATTEPVLPPNLPVGFGAADSTWDDVADRARFVLDVGAGRIVEGVNKNAFNPTEAWYLEQLRPYWVAGG